LDVPPLPSNLVSESSQATSASEHQCRVHETGIKIICEYILQDGRRLGTRRLASIDTAFVDQLFEKLLFKTVNGGKVERRTTVNHAMKTARGAWNTVSRANPGLFPPHNPFEKMGVCTENLTPNVLTMKSAQYGARIYDAGSLNLARDRRIFVQ
jgi:hypothetical protein